jgi:hypothetical protein
VGCYFLDAEFGAAELLGWGEVVGGDVIGEGEEFLVDDVEKAGRLGEKGILEFVGRSDTVTRAKDDRGGVKVVEC